jgi:urease accessory protein
MNTESFLHILQFTDGLFPTGAYAHSFGLETCVQNGEVRDAAGVESFLRVYLEGAAAPTDAVLTLCARVAAIEGDLAACIRLDHKVHATKPAAELREASRQMGKQTLRILAELHDHSLVREFAAEVAIGAAHGHHPVSYGIVGGVLNWPAPESAAAYLYATSAVMVGASLRLLPLGQLAGQRILWNIQPLIAKLARDIQDRGEDDIWTFAPQLEIASMRHETLEARLFRS